MSILAPQDIIWNISILFTKWCHPRLPSSTSYHFVRQTVSFTFLLCDTRSQRRTISETLFSNVLRFNYVSQGHMKITTVLEFVLSLPHTI